MRVYEFAKKYGVATKELIKVLNDANFEIGSHMAVLEGDALGFLENKFAKQPDERVGEVSPEESPLEGEKKVKVKKKSDDERALLLEPMALTDIAHKINIPVNELILTLLKWGVIVTKNQFVTADIVVRIAKHYAIPVFKPEKEKAHVFGDIVAGEANLKSRLPIVVVLGHVDHGKTTLLDFIRKTRVAIKEKGGITQHLGAYEAQTAHGNIIFIDTPGHEAFSKMRGRGARVADIAILIIAAEDGVMPQTIEAIKHAKEAKIPIIVAINKVDKASKAQIEVVKRSLAQHDLLPEDWGGEIICIPISAKLGQGVDHLLEMITLQAQMMELQADVSSAGRGYVLESKPEKGRGPVATILCRHGKINVGDYFVCGDTFGKVSSLVDSAGNSAKEVGPSIPVQVAGFSLLPEVGDLFKVVPREEYYKARSGIESRVKARRKQFGLEGAINIIVKTDSNSSKEALLESIAKLSKKSDKECNIIYTGVGNVSERDVVLASNTGSVIYTLHVKADVNALSIAQRYNVSINSFDIIYKLLEELEERFKGDQEVKMVSVKIGEAIVRKVFDIKNIGVIAGCYVTEGTVSRNCSVVVWRRNKQIGSGKIKSLQREKKTVKEVHAGFECGFIVEGFVDWAIDDRIECFIEKAEKAKA